MPSIGLTNFDILNLSSTFPCFLVPKDIVKLTDDPPKDVYGRHVPLPSHNLFVAGTSCKNFSALRSRKMIDIEEMGCSGETFLAACELLFQEKPKYAIFENVDKAVSHPRLNRLSLHSQNFILLTIYPSFSSRGVK